jgi:hypothetical protein
MDLLWQHLNRIADTLVVIGPLVLFGYRWIRRISLDAGFTRTVAKTHLPHIYGRLHALDGEEHPSIVYINGGGTSERVARTL